MRTSDMKSITSLQEFVAWAKEVNLCPHSTKRWCDLQDIFAHSDSQALISWYLSKEAEGDRRILLFSVYKNQGDDAFIRFTTSFAHNEARKQIKTWEAEYDKEYSERFKELNDLTAKLNERELKLSQREKDQPEWRKAAYKRINELQSRIKLNTEKRLVLIDRVKELEAQLREEKQKASGRPKRMISV